MTEFAVFLLETGLGAALGGVYLFMGLLRKSGGVLGTVIADCLFVVLFFAPPLILGLVLFDGKLKIFSVVGQLIGLAAVLFFAHKISRRFRRGKAAKERTDDMKRP